MEKEEEVCANCEVSGGKLVGARRVSDGERVYIHEGSCERHLKFSLEASQRKAAELREALEACDKAFVSWQVGQIPGRPEDILELISRVRAALARLKDEK